MTTKHTNENQQLEDKTDSLTLTLLIFCQSLSSLAFSSLGPARRVFRPSDILIPNWKAALKKQQKRHLYYFVRD